MTSVTIIGGSPELAEELDGDEVSVRDCVVDVSALPAALDDSSDVWVVVDEADRILDTCRLVRRRWPEAKVVVASSEVPATVSHLLHGGVLGLVDVGDREQLRLAILCADRGGAVVSPRALRMVAEMVTVSSHLAELGEYGVTRTELMVWRLAGGGLMNREIAVQLDRGLATVRTHLQHLHAKLGTTSRTELIDAWQRLAEQSPAADS